MYKNQVDQDKKDAKVLKRIINEILFKKIIQKNITKKIIDILWIDDTKDRDSTELLSIQSFLDAINNEDITNKDDARKEFIKLKKNVNSDKLKDIVKELERAIFGYEELSGSGLKILTNKQMLNHLPILLAQIQAGNNSNKLKNEARQILYSLYRLKVLTKTVYNNLIKAIRA